MYINGYYHLPMFYFESIWCFIGFIIALILRRKRYIKKGQLTGFYLMWYGAARFVIEIFRTDSLMLGNLKVARIVSVIMFIIGFVIELIQGKKPKLDELYKAEIKTVEQLEKEEIEKAINKYGSNTQEMKQVAKALNIGIATLYRKVKKYNIKTGE